MANPNPNPTSSQPAAPAATGDWFVRIVFAGQAEEWLFACTDAIRNELRAAMAEGRVARWEFDGTEGFINTAHIARLEFQKQPAA